MAVVLESEAEPSARRFATRPEGRSFRVFQDALVRNTAEPAFQRGNRVECHR
jgi:hypothetical protein